MAKNRNKPPASNKHPETSDIPLEDFHQELEAALAADDHARALKLVDSAPRWLKKQPEYMLMQATVLLASGEEQQGYDLLREMEKKHPRFMPLYLPLAMIYSGRGLPGHALQAAMRGQTDRELLDENRAALADVIEEARVEIQSLATKFDLPFETMQRACILEERAQQALDDYKLVEVDYFCRETIKIAPNWNRPHCDRAEALYFLGKEEEAISVLEAVLARGAEDALALSNLAAYHFGLNRPEQAREYANRLEKLSDQFPVDSMEIEHAITALAIVEDTPTLWKIAQRYLRAPAKSLFGHSWHCLAVAAIRNRKWKEARKLLRKADGEELPKDGQALLAELETVARDKTPHLAWMPPTYPGADFFFHPYVMAEWQSMVEKFTPPLSDSQTRKVDQFFQKYPFVVTAMRRMLWNENGHQMALEILSQLDREDAKTEIQQFALSQTGSQEVRVQALMNLIQNGRYSGPKIVAIWNEERGEWRDVELNTQKIGDIKVNARPETLALIEKAHRAKNPAEAIALMRKAVEKEPTSPLAVFNLGVMLAQNGREEEGEAFIHRSVEIDPNYTYGHASIGLSEALEGHELEARDHLEIVSRADIIAPDTAVLANLAWLVLAIQKNEVKSARRHFEIATKLNPDHSMLKQFEDMLIQAETFNRSYHNLLEFTRKSNQRAHQKLLNIPLHQDMKLRACLETNTKEMLVGAARFLRTFSSGKKGELVSRLEELILDAEYLQETLDEDLAEKEREALRWMLEADGVRPWKEFARKYGDDEDESTGWSYREPTSIPGRLRMSGLLYSGWLEGQPVAFIPVDARPVLRKVL